MTDICSTCQEPLLIEFEADSDLEDTKAAAPLQSIPDDVELTCGCHFHWECFLDAYTITQCPTCSNDISTLSPTGQQQVLCIVRNEGGEQKSFDILPTATEEAYLRAYPEERKGHAYLQFCREGDIDALVHLIQDEDEEDEDITEAGDIMRYQGTFEGIDGSGLHQAIRYHREEVAWLLLALGSSLDWSKFPPVALQAMENLGLSKSDRRATPDVRSLQDSNGKTPLALAMEIGQPWNSWVADGRFGT